uniref:transcriptional regulator n=1 Tax=Waltera sp. TaxID=2815806 RepID=UPI003A8ECA08
DDMIELLKSGLVDNSLLCELATHPDFPQLMADLEIYVNGIAGKQVQSANAIVDAVSATIMKQHNPGLSDPQLRQLIAAHIDDDSFCRYVIQQDINKIALDLREAHKDDFFSVPEDNPLEDFLQTAEETAKEDSDPEQAALAFICKRLKLNLKKLSEEEKKWLKKIAQKSDLLKNPTPQRGRK